MSNRQALKALNLVTVALISIFAVKLLCVWYFTSRFYTDAFGPLLGYPYDALAFDTPDRFTDWLITAAQAKMSNPYDILALHRLGIPAPPYGYFSLLCMKLAGMIGLMPMFLLSIAAYLYLNFQILKQRAELPLLAAIQAFAALIIGCYPLYFEIDRGNIAIWGALALSGVLLSCLARPNRWLIVFVLAAAACLKPAFLLLILPVVAIANVPQIAAALALVALNYLIPMLLPGSSPLYMVKAIQDVVAVLGPQSVFCHNVSCALRSVGAPPMAALIAVGFSLPMFYIAYRVRRSNDPWRHAPTFISVTVLTSMLIADPSSDYALTMLLPIFLMTLGDPLLNVDALSGRSTGPYLLVGFVLAMSFVNMPFPHLPNFTALLRCVGVLSWYGLFIQRSIVNLMPAENVPIDVETYESHIVPTAPAAHIGR